MNENEQAYKLTRAALACAIVGLFLWLLSYLWVPLSLIPSLKGRDLSFLAPVLPASEAGAILIAMIGIGFAVGARQLSEPGMPEHRLASRRLMINVLVPVLVIVPNIVFPLLLSS